MPQITFLIDDCWEILDDDEQPAPDALSAYREQEIRAINLARKCL